MTFNGFTTDGKPHRKVYGKIWEAFYISNNIELH